MNAYSLSHVPNDALLRDLDRSVKQDRATNDTLLAQIAEVAQHALLRLPATRSKQDRAPTATMLAQIAEVDERKLFAGAGYESMFSYCVRELHMSEDTAFRRIRVARTAVSSDMCSS